MERAKNIKNESEETLRYEALTNDEVLVQSGMAPVAVELAILRLKWFADVMRDPSHHRQYLAALLGIDTNGVLFEHPHLSQLRNDLDLCAHIDSFTDSAGGVAESPEMFLKDPELRKTFSNIDFSEIRARFTMPCVPPPS